MRINSYEENILKLSSVYEKKGIYSNECFTEDTAVKIFKKTHPEERFNRDIETFLSLHSYKPKRIGADLPYWGKYYFTNEDGKRVFIIAQDSNTPDAGSIVFYAHMMAIADMKQGSYQTYINRNNLQRYDSWQMVKDYFNSCGINLSFAFLTDARKVYPLSSLEFKENIEDNESLKKEKAKKRRSLLSSKKNFSENRLLLREEIAVTDPDIIIALGTSALSLLNDTVGKMTDLLEQNKIVLPLDEKIVTQSGKHITEFILSPFPGRANQGTFNKYKEKVKMEVKKQLSSI